MAPAWDQVEGEEKEAENEKEGVEVNTEWATNRNAELGSQSTAFWRALKKLTEEHSDARLVVTSVAGEDGFAAWAKMHRRFGMALAMRQGTMLANLSLANLSSALRISS